MKETIAVALASLRANTLRSLLTMLGIVIGIAAVIAVVGLGLGAQQSVSARLSRLGTTLLQVDPQRQRRGGVQWTELKRLTIDDADMLNERGTTFAAVQPQADRNLQVVYGRYNTNVRITATSANFLQVRGFELARGRMFTEGEDRGLQRVAVVGSAVLTDLGLPLTTTILGQNIRVGGQQFKVIGVLQPRGRAEAGGNPDEQVLIPLRTGRFRLFGTEWLNDIFVLANSEDDVPAAMVEIRSILRRAHRLTYDQEDDFRIRNQSDFLEVLRSTAEIFTYLLSGIAAVSLVVGGIGIMNIMLVSVTERTREIGIRKALGATRRTILLQFLVEAVVICILGGLIGVAFGCSTLVVLREFFGWSTAIEPFAVLGGVGFAGVIGVVFGVWPARRAAVLDPIVALRYE